jgi:hypothetical protein
MHVGVEAVLATYFRQQCCMGVIAPHNGLSNGLRENVKKSAVILAETERLSRSAQHDSAIIAVPCQCCKVRARMGPANIP